MTPSENVEIARAFMAAVGSGASSDALLDMFTDDLSFAVPGDPAAFPWVGRAGGRTSLRSLLDGIRSLLVHERLDGDDIIAGETRAVILGSLASRVVATGRLIESPFAIVLTIVAGRISGFLMFEDSFAVSKAAQSPP